MGGLPGDMHASPGTQKAQAAGGMSGWRLISGMPKVASLQVLLHVGAV